jgi:hypothetical protein
MLRPEEIVGIAARMVAVAIKTNRAMEAAMISAGTTITASTTGAPITPMTTATMVAATTTISSRGITLSMEVANRAPGRCVRSVARRVTQR